MERNNVLLKITDLRQYFPVGKKKGLYVKANDGISLNIYEGETVGLVGESGCGKSTFGRTLLQLYRQTDGKTMYYGASRDELAPSISKRPSAICPTACMSWPRSKSATRCRRSMMLPMSRSACTCTTISRLRRRLQMMPI